MPATIATAMSALRFIFIIIPRTPFDSFLLTRSWLLINFPHFKTNAWPTRGFRIKGRLGEPTHDHDKCVLLAMSSSVFASGAIEKFLGEKFLSMSRNQEVLVGRNHPDRDRRL